MSRLHSRRRFLATSAAVAAGLAGKPKLAALAQSSDTSTAATHLNPDWQREGVLDLSRSPHAKLKTVPVRAVRIYDGFWSKRRVTNVQASLPSMKQELLDHGRMDNFLRLEGKSQAPQRGPLYSDSDIYKWLEAAAFVLQGSRDPALRSSTRTMIEQVVATQEPSGYLNTYYVEARKPERMLPHSQEVGHELYCIGHLLQAGIAYYRATGDPTLVNAGIRFVDDFLIPGYGPGPDQKGIVAGHPEIEMALVELYRTTGQRRYLDLAGYILHGDSRILPTPRQVTYMFCGVPFTTRTRLEGHAVRAMYACCGATDYYLETGDAAYWKTLNVLWNDLSEHQMYVTGGVGARAEGEAFGEPYELPNARAYGESCAAIGNMMWNWRMLAASGEARFTEVMERALYNGINSGMSLDGTMYCYRNPLAFDPSTGDKIRNPWYDTTCCPPNIERTLASLPGYFYSTSPEGVYVHFYDNSEVNWHLDNGTPFKLEQTTNYPWSGEVKLTISPAQLVEFTLFVRIPAWSHTNRVSVNGTAVADVVPGEYLALKRRWEAGDEVALAFDMHPQLIRANPAVAEDTGRVAVQRGPLVYCMEHLDQRRADAAPTEDLSLFTASLTETINARYDPHMLDGIMVLEHPGTHAGSANASSLYASAVPAKNGDSPATLKLIPYYAWANREPSAMQVWILATQA